MSLNNSIDAKVTGFQSLNTANGDWEGRTLIGGTGVLITNGNGTTGDPVISVDGSVVGETITGNSGGALSPTAGNWNILGASTASGTSPVSTSGAVSTLTVNVQKTQAIAATDATKVGLGAFDSAKFSVDANGFVTTSGTGILNTLTGNTGGAISPTAGNINTLGTGSITIAGAGSTLTTQLTGLTNHAVLVGAGTATITKVGPTATIGQVLQSAGAAADPAFSTATYPLTTTISQLLYSSAANTVTGLATANRAVLTTGTTGVPVMTALATDGQLIIGSTAGAPAAATLTAGTGISITNASNAITVAVSGSAVGQTITGDTGGALSPTAGNWNIKAGTSTQNAGSSVSFSGAGSTLTFNVTNGTGTIIGSGAGNATISGASLVGLGQNVLASATSAASAVAIGPFAAQGATTASSFVAIGNSTLQSTTTGNSNTGVGSGVMANLVTGSSNIAIGIGAGNNYTGAESSNILIANQGTLGESNAIHIGTQGSGSGQQNTCFIAGITGVSVSNLNFVTIDTTTGQLGSASTAGMITAWTDVTGATQTLAVNNGYFTDRSGGVTYTLPSTATLGDLIRIDGKLGLATVAQNANQAIRLGSSITTTGVTGSLTATNVGDCLALRCSTAGASTIWVVESSMGNWTVA